MIVGVGAISPRFPFGGINSWAIHECKHLLEHVGKVLGTALDRQEHVVALSCCADARLGGWSLGGDQYWRNGWLVAGFVEVLDVKGVVPYLIDGVRCELLLADFELKDKNDGSNQGNDINSPAEPRDRVFEI